MLKVQAISENRQTTLGGYFLTHPVHTTLYSPPELFADFSKMAWTFNIQFQTLIIQHFRLQTR